MSVLSKESATMTGMLWLRASDGTHVLPCLQLLTKPQTLPAHPEDSGQPGPGHPRRHTHMHSPPPHPPQLAASVLAQLHGQGRSPRQPAYGKTTQQKHSPPSKREFWGAGYRSIPPGGRYRGASALGGALSQQGPQAHRVQGPALPWGASQGWLGDSLLVCLVLRPGDVVRGTLGSGPRSRASP